jgi:hypothetical protein
VIAFEVLGRGLAPAPPGAPCEREVYAPASKQWSDAWGAAMLGDKLGVLTGTVTGQRVLPSGEGPHVESTFEVSGDWGGVGTTLMGTYWAKVRGDGLVHRGRHGHGVPGRPLSVVGTAGAGTFVPGRPRLPLGGRRQEQRQGRVLGLDLTPLMPGHWAGGL